MYSTCFGRFPRQCKHTWKFESPSLSSSLPFRVTFVRWRVSLSLRSTWPYAGITSYDSCRMRMPLATLSARPSWGSSASVSLGRSVGRSVRPCRHLTLPDENARPRLCLSNLKFLPHFSTISASPLNSLPTFVQCRLGLRSLGLRKRCDVALRSISTI